MWVGEKLKDGLVRYNLTDGTREVMISLDDYQSRLNPDDGSAVTPNFGAFAFDTSDETLWFSIYDNYGRYPTKIFNREWNITSPTIEPYTEYDIGHALAFQLRGMAVNPGKELFYITDDMDHTQTISRMILPSALQYPPFPDAELLTPSSAYISKSINVIPGTTLDYNPHYPNSNDTITTASGDIVPQDWNDGNDRLIWMEWNGAFYNAAIRVAKELSYGTSFLNDRVNLFERTGVTTQRFSVDIYGFIK